MFAKWEGIIISLNINNASLGTKLSAFLKNKLFLRSKITQLSPKHVKIRWIDFV